MKTRIKTSMKISKKFMAMMMVLVLSVMMSGSLKASAKSSPHLYINADTEGATYQKGTTAELHFTVYHGGYYMEKYYSEVYEGRLSTSEIQDLPGDDSRSPVASTDGYITSNLNLTLTWDTDDYKPGTYTVVAYTAFMYNGSWKFYSSDVKSSYITLEGSDDDSSMYDDDDSNLDSQYITVGKIKSYKASKLKKKKVSFYLNAETSGNGSLSFKVTKGKKKNITVSKYGKVTLKKGCKKGTYKIKITASKTSRYMKATKTVSIKVK